MKLICMKVMINMKGMKEESNFNIDMVLNAVNIPLSQEVVVAPKGFRVLLMKEKEDEKDCKVKLS